MKTKSTKQTKQGISLIVLVITIIVMIILAAAVILSLSSNGIIDRANEAVEKTDLVQVQTLASTIWAEIYLENMDKAENERIDYEKEIINRLQTQKIDTSKYNIIADDKGVTVSLKGLLNEYGFYYDKPYIQIGNDNDLRYCVLKSNNVLEWYYYEPRLGLYYVFDGMDDAEFQEGKIITEWGEMTVSNEGKTIVEGEVEYVCVEEEYRNIYYNVPYYSQDQTEFWVFKENGTMEIYDATTSELLSTVAIATASHIITDGDEELYVSMDGKTIAYGEGFYRYNEYIANHENIIPLGGIYITEDGTELYGGDEFPKVSVTGDVYIYGDYEYMYNGYYAVNKRLRISMGPSWLVDELQNGWGVKVSSHIKKKTSYENIIESINNKSISSLSYTYYNCSNMLEPANNIHKLSEVIDMSHMFWECRALKSLPNEFSIPNKVTNVEGMFMSCTSLTILPNSFSIPEGITSLESMFSGSSLKNVTNLFIPNTVIDMTDTFSGCDFTDLSDLVIPSSVTNLSETFYMCRSLITAPKISGEVINMYRTFYGCEALTGVLTINAELSDWEDCVDGTENSLTVFGTSLNLGKMVVGAKNAKAIINVPEGTTVIPSNILNECTGIIEKIVIPEGVTEIEPGAFRYCTYLQGITLPKSLTKIGNEAFFSTAIHEIYYNGTIEQWDAIEKGLDWFGFENTTDQYTVHCADGSFSRSA